MERNSWRTTHSRDGLMDILFGFMLLGACVSALVGLWNKPDWLRMLSLSVIQFGGVAFLVWMRRKVVAPRIGRVKFAATRMRNVRFLRVLMGICVLATIAIVAATALQERLGFSLFGGGGAWSVLGVVAAVVMIPIAALAVVLDNPRLLLHGSLFVIAEFLLLVVRMEEITAYAGPIIYGIASAISFSIGIPIFVHFLRSIHRAAPEDCGVVHE